jgi:hypothetical protein
MSDNLKVATICGVRVSGLFLMKAKTPGVCGQTNKNYPAGELILNKWGSKLTPAERSGLFGTGRTCDITVLWDAVKNIPVEDEDSDYSNEEMDLLAENQRRYTEQQAARQVEQRAQRKKSDFKPSSYQETIKEALLTTGKNLLIDARLAHLGAVQPWLPQGEDGLLPRLQRQHSGRHHARVEGIWCPGAHQSPILPSPRPWL